MTRKARPGKPGPKPLSDHAKRFRGTHREDRGNRFQPQPKGKATCPRDGNDQPSIRYGQRRLFAPAGTGAGQIATAAAAIPGAPTSLSSRELP